MNREDILKDVQFGIGYLPIKKMAILGGFSESTIRRHEETGKIPKRTTVSCRIKGWPMKDVLDIVEKMGEPT